MSKLSRIFASLFGVAAALPAFAACQRAQGETGARAETERVFYSLCARCHGKDGGGGIPAAEGLPAPTNFRDPAFHAGRDDEALKQAILKGKGPMPPFAGVLDAAQVDALVRYIRDFDARP